jgi:hypothetical protein
MSEAAQPAAPTSALSYLWRILTWLLAAGCFYLIFTRIEGAAARDGLTVWSYLSKFIGDANWFAWLAVMVPYSVFFFLVDAHVTWRVVRWFNAPDLKFKEMLPIRASAYILSLVNEQVGKGAMTLYLLKRYRVAGWETLSSMILLGLMEIYQLLFFSAVGMFFYADVVTQASTVLPLDTILPAVFFGALIYLPLHILYFRGHILKGFKLRDKALLRSFREARPVHYLLILLFKSPTLLGGVVVYTVTLALFNVPVQAGAMLALLPLIFLAAALPLPFHAGALVFWTVLFPDYPEVGIFSMVMHTFFVLFNAAIGLLFLPRANKELFGADTRGLK